MKATFGSSTIAYVSDYFEWKGSTSTMKYYYAGGQRVAMRQGGTLTHPHTDHLGSATLATDAGGNRTGELRYTPYGVMRYEWGNIPTNRRYTGQWLDSALGLYDYRARYYSPGLGRFVSADTVVPNPLDPQLFNRYSYTRNSPVLYNDPDGHCGPLCIIGVAAALVAVLMLTSDVAPPPDSPVAYSRAGNQAVGEIAFGIASAYGVTTLAVPIVTIPVTAQTMAKAAAAGACADGDCTNEIAKVAETGARAIETVSADGDPTNEAQAAVRVFWSGGDVARRAAQDWARANNGTTLEMTKVGQRLEETTRGLDWLTQARPQWVAASREFAAGASGEVHVFQNAAGVSLQSIWATVEYLVLMSNPNVTRIVYHVVLPNSQRVGLNIKLCWCPHLTIMDTVQYIGIDHNVDQCVPVLHRADVAHFGALDAQRYGLAVNAFTGCALVIDDRVLW